MAKGGIRIGAGRKPKAEGRKYFREYWSDEEKEQYMKDLKAVYSSNSQLLQYVGDQIFGKAPQALTLDGGLHNTITIEFTLKNPPANALSTTSRDTLRSASIYSLSSGQALGQNNGSA